MQYRYFGSKYILIPLNNSLDILLLANCYGNNLNGFFIVLSICFNRQ